MFPSSHPRSPCLFLCLFQILPPFLIELSIFSPSSILSFSVLHATPSTLGACSVLFVSSRYLLLALVGRHPLPNPCSVSPLMDLCVPFSSYAPQSSILVGITSIPNSCFWFSWGFLHHSGLASLVFIEHTFMVIAFTQTWDSNSSSSSSSISTWAPATREEPPSCLGHSHAKCGPPHLKQPQSCWDMLWIMCPNPLPSLSLHTPIGHKSSSFIAPWVLPCVGTPPNHTLLHYFVCIFQCFRFHLCLLSSHRWS